MAEGKPRIAILTNWYPSENAPYYGIFIKNQAILLSERYDVHIIRFSLGLNFKTEEYKADGLTIHHRHEPYVPKRNVITYKYWAKRFSKFIGSLDGRYSFEFIHAHDYQPAIAAYYYHLATKKKYYVTIHNTAFIKGTIEKYKHRLIQPALENSEKVISVGEVLNDRLKSIYHLDNSVIIPNHVDTDRFDIMTSKSENFVFLMVGYLNEVKGTKKVIDAFIRANINQAQLHLVGENELEKEYIDNIIKENHNIIYRGAIKHHLIHQVYNQANCLISYSEVETFGITVIEAMSCGLPVIYKASGGPEDVVPDYGGVEVNNELELQKSIKSVAEKNLEFDNLRIRSYTIENYSEEVILEQMIEIYKHNKSI